MSYAFVKGHGTENDFVLLPDHDGSVHGDLGTDAGRARVRALCDRRSGIGGDGVLRVVRTAAFDPAQGAESEWFMDYRNADGSVSQMCGNGIRVFAQHLAESGLIEPGAHVPIGTRDGVKELTPAGDGAWTVDLGRPEIRGETKIGLANAVHEWAWPALHVSTGNPHAVAFVEDLDELTPPGIPLPEPDYDREVYPDGVNVEFVVRRGPGHVAMRVHERGSGETRSCGTGAGAVTVAAAVADGGGAGTTYTVDVPGGRLSVTWSPEGRLLLTGPAVLVAEGRTGL